MYSFSKPGIFEIKGYQGLRQESSPDTTHTTHRVKRTNGAKLPCGTGDGYRPAGISRTNR